MLKRLNLTLVFQKSAFKRAVGHLLKAGLIEENKDAGTITLIKDPKEDVDDE